MGKERDVMGHTGRLRLEALTEDHAAAMWAALSDERLYAYITEPRYPSVQALQARYRRLAAGSPSPDETWWNFILFRTGTDEPLGFVQATLRPAQAMAEVAYLLAPRHWGQGYATEALGWLLQALAARGDIARAQAQVDVRNTASLAVLHRLGFVLVRTVEDAQSTDHVFERSLAGLAPPARPGAS
ncbi:MULTISPECIES: GNAT family N-acetyltransferase [Ramlibacter]|uniref:GNAT family N-acetyltransferase n=1 Tax=Ramlibacter aquaticus TaxID=2780094 RepID=A0ABR9S9L0_9BURK|nr:MULTISPECIES: GNAT family N-acetyltransferase [Ramlibacter]MBE7939040.1 GNAT family N-acetyltransferase [Ramlibacter aquaticus]